ncbi:MAG TPA: cysteine rich repeat-containing protein [Burkholderiaceae bacterium]|nr:cysteine rich repeat-containing protein [Burkholderiaceae bacterium]
MHTDVPRVARLIGGALLMAFALSGATAWAQEGCRADLAKFCPQAKAGDGTVAACLETNKAQLSAPCREHVARMTELLKEVDKACEEDIHAHCPGVQPGGGRVAACLKQNVSSLSFRCKVKLAEARAAK